MKEYKVNIVTDVDDMRDCALEFSCPLPVSIERNTLHCGMIQFKLSVEFGMTWFSHLHVKSAHPSGDTWELLQVQKPYD